MRALVRSLGRDLRGALVDDVRDVGDEVRRLLATGVAIAGVAAVPWVRGRLLRAGATVDEVGALLAGDDLLPDADLIATRAITIDAPPERVWPWVAQIGQGRGGFYSYDTLENLAGSHIHSAVTIVPEWQDVRVGDVVRLHPQLALEVAQVDAPHAFVIKSAPTTPSASPPPYDFTWSFVLDETADAGTRLVVRERYRYTTRNAALVAEPVAVASFVMTQRMLRGIRARAERFGLAPHEIVTPGLYLYWIPLGAGATVVRVSGAIYEALWAAAHCEPRRALYHSALVADTGDGRYVIEVTPIPDDRGRDERGVVGEGPVGSRLLARWRVFRYEVRAWRNGTIPDVDYAIESPVKLTADVDVVARVLADVSHVPTPVWGRDAQHTGDMWNSNSVVAWLLARAQLLDVAAAPPFGGRAPGWDAGYRLVAETGLPAVFSTAREDL
jgi:hypothetical protein